MSPTHPTSAEPLAVPNESAFRADLRGRFAASRFETDPLRDAGEPGAPLVGLRAFAEAARESRALLHQIAGPGHGLEMAALETALVDEVLRELYERAVGAEEEGAAEPDPGELAVAAAGGYGRSELMPFSDVDVVIIAPDEDHPVCDRIIRRLYHGVFDVLSARLGVEVGYSCRSAAHPGELDTNTLTALSETRLIAGSRDAYEHFLDAVSAHVDPARLLIRFAAEREAQRLDFSPAVHRVEPNLKHDPGGLRDLLSAFWHARAAFGLRAPSALSELRDRAILSYSEAHDVQGALEQILAERRAAHVVSGRRTDTLYISLQEPVARWLGYRDLDSLSAVDQLMHDHYAAAECVHRYARALCARAHDAVVPVGADFAVRQGRLCPSPTVSLLETPGRAVEAVALADAYGIPLCPTLEDECREAAQEIGEAHAGTPEADALLRILSARGRPGPAIRRLSELGILSCLVPELGVCARRVPTDPMHEYAILEHTIQVIEHLDELREADQPILSTLSRTYAAISDSARRALMLAALLHDAGKVMDGERHSQIGAEIARRVGARLGLPDAEVDGAAQLIERHLLMARTSRLRDLQDPATIREFCEAVPDAEMLDLLYLLTYADTKAVGLGVFGDVEARLLEDLYAKALATLSQGMDAPDLEEAKAIITERAVRELRFRDISEERVREHCELMPAEYVVGMPLGLLGAHIVMIRDLQRDRGPLLEFYNDPDVGFTELTICAYDDPKPGLFAKICGTLLANGIDIHSANIRTRAGEDPIALDALLISCDGRRIEGDLADRTERDVRSVLLGEAEVHQLLGRRRRHPHPVKDLVISASNAVAEHRTVIHASAADSLGLLYRITRAMAASGLNLHAAQITTWGARAEDSFYVTHFDGGRPVPAERLADLEREIADGVLREEAE